MFPHQNPRIHVFFLESLSNFWRMENNDPTARDFSIRVQATINIGGGLSECPEISSLQRHFCELRFELAVAYLLSHLVI